MTTLLRMLREKAGLSRDELASKAGITTSQLRYLEKGQAKSMDEDTVARLRAIARVLPKGPWPEQDPAALVGPSEGFDIDLPDDSPHGGHDTPGDITPSDVILRAGFEAGFRAAIRALAGPRAKGFRELNHLVESQADAYVRLQQLEDDIEGEA